VAVSTNRWHAPTALVNTLRHIGRYSGTTLPVAALLASPLLFVSLAQWASFGRGRINFGWTLIWISLLIVSLFTASIWLQAAIITATQRFRDGEATGIFGALALSLGPTLKLLGTVILVGILFIGAAVAGSVPLLGVFLIGIADPGPTQFDGPLLVLLILAILIGVAIFGFLAVVIFFRYALAPTAAVIETRSPIDALDRSRRLMRGRWLDFFLLTLMVWVVTLAIQILVGAPAFLVSFRGSTGGLGMNPIAVLLRPPQIGLAAALITAISTYLVQVATPLVAFGARANFFLDIKSEESDASQTLSAGDDDSGTGAARHDNGDTGEEDGGPRDDEKTGNLTE
jgi:hypothetical protein